MENQNSIKNIIFDFGGIILDIDHRKVEKAFMELGLENFDELFSRAVQADLFQKFETGAISPDKFRNELKKLTGLNITDDILDFTWNQILGDYPEHRIELLKKLRVNYNLYILSNTNEIHYMDYMGNFQRTFGYDFNTLFDKTFWSFKIGKRKPDANSFLYLLDTCNILPEESIFIDDTLPNVVAARELNIKSYYLKPGNDVSELFVEGFLKNSIVNVL